MASQPDAAAAEALGEDVRRPAVFVFLDIADEPIRVTSAPYSVQFTDTGDEDLDGFTFEATDSRFVSVSPVKVRDDGTDTVTFKLSGLAGLDDELMTILGNKANFQGRDCRVWYAMLEPATFGRIGAIWCDFTGYMNVPKVVIDDESQEIVLDAETYLAFLRRPSGRTYLDQAGFDAGDLSAELAVAIANGAGNRRV